MGNKRLFAEAGFSITETLVAVSILVLVVISAVSVMIVGQRSSKAIIDWTDQTEELRIAVRQMTEDFSYAFYLAGNTNGSIQVYVEQPFTTKDVGWSDLVWDASQEAWPGDMVDWPQVNIQYTLTGGVLTRQVFTGTGTGPQLVSSQSLATQLAADSALWPDTNNPKLIHVVLRRSVTGGKRVAEVQSQFYLR